MPDPAPISDDDLDTVGYTLYGEARGEPLEGQQAVAWVIRNRATWQPQEWWGATPGEVCLKPQQFSCWNKDDPNYTLLQGLSLGDQTFLALRAIAEDVFDGAIADPTGGATHYYADSIQPPAWAKDHPWIRIGRQLFYRIGP